MNVDTDHFCVLLDRFLAGDLSPEEMAMLERTATQSPDLRALLAEAQAFSTLMGGALNAAASGERSASAGSEAAEEGGASSDVTRVDLLLSGMLSAEEEAELRADAASDPALAGELHEADGVTRLLTDVFAVISTSTHEPIVSGTEMIDRYLAGDLGTTEQAELFAHASGESVLARKLGDARNYERLMRDSLRLAAAGAPGRAQAVVAEIHSLPVLDEMVDRYLSGELADDEIATLREAALTVPSVAARLQQSDAYAKLMQQTFESAGGYKRISSRRNTATPSARDVRQTAQSPDNAYRQVVPAPSTRLPVVRAQQQPRRRGVVIHMKSRARGTWGAAVAASVFVALAIGAGWVAVSLLDKNGTAAGPNNTATNGNPVVENPPLPVVNPSVEPPRPPSGVVVVKDNQKPAGDTPVTPPNNPGLGTEVKAPPETPKTQPTPVEESKPVGGETVKNDPTKEPGKETHTPTGTPKGPTANPVVNRDPAHETEPSRRTGHTTETDAPLKGVEVSIALDEELARKRDDMLAMTREELLDRQLENGRFDIFGDWEEDNEEPSGPNSSPESDPVPIPGAKPKPVVVPGGRSSSSPARTRNERHPDTRSPGLGLRRPRAKPGEKPSDSSHRPGDASQPKHRVSGSRPVADLIPNETAVNAICVRALLAAGEPVDSDAIKRGTKAVVELYEKIKGAKNAGLTVQDASAILALFEQYYRVTDAAERAKLRGAAYRPVRSEHKRVVKELAQFIAKGQQRDSGLWTVCGSLSYGDVDTPGTVCNWAGRKVSGDLLNSFAAVQGLEAARVLGESINEDVYVSLAKGLVNLQSNKGVEMSAKFAEWDAKGGRYIVRDDAAASAGRARGWTLTGDLQHDQTHAELPRTGAMTASAVYMLSVCRAQLTAQKQLGKVNGDKLDRSLTDGCSWLLHHFTLDGNSQSYDDERKVAPTTQLHYLYLYALGEAMRARNTPVLGDKAWFAQMTQAAVNASESDAWSDCGASLDMFAAHPALYNANPFVRHALTALALDDRGMATPDGKSVSGK